MAGDDAKPRGTLPAYVSFVEEMAWEEATLFLPSST
jgi:hypothetical protein